MRTARIHYRRLPDREQLFEQRLLDETPECSVTFVDAVALSRPVLADGRTILEPGAPVLWFTFPGRWYDIGRFHLTDGTFTGHYANLLTPVRMHGDEWWTTDLCLDVWKGADGEVLLLDEDEFDEARARGWMDDATADTALREAHALVAAAQDGAWPPPEVLAWTLERAREA